MYSFGWLRGEALVKLDDVGGVRPDQGLGFVRANAIADQPDLIRLVDR